MNIKFELTQKLDQRLTMNQQLRQAIMLLQYNTIDLKEMVKKLIEENPLLEAEHEDINTQSDIKAQQENAYLYSPDITTELGGRSDFYLDNITAPPNLRQHLMAQTVYCQFSNLETDIVEAIIDGIDDNGYLSMSIDEIIHSLSLSDVTADLIEKMITKVQSFDPPGICARNLRECLFLQLQSLKDKNAYWEIACKIVNEYFEAKKLINNRHILKSLQISQHDYLMALNLIKSLNPRPGLLYALDIHSDIEPELYVKKIKNSWRVFITESILTNVRVNQHYQELIRQRKRSDKGKSLHKELQEAQWLIKGIKRRNETLLAVGSFIMESQLEFLEHGPAYVKSMNLQEVAQALSLHESTISRITTGKYIATSWGVFELKYFFPSHVTTMTGEICSAATVKALIKKIIDEEISSNILSDNDIMMILKEQGINIARRTVAKYREELNILPSYQRIKVG
jgi:RNA polymerase sigma-54 factor